VTRPVDLPTNDEVLRAKTDLLAQAHASGARPTVVALARRLGLSNPTFWRHFPDIAREVADHARNASAHDTSPETRSPIQQLQQRVAHLTAANQTLTEHLELAVANIQRLTLDNHRLRLELEAAANITHLPARPQPSTTPAGR
jgi:AcrR family transcriptional regulator